MEDLHVAAQAYYNNAPTEVQQLAQNFFRIMDVNGDGRVSYVEFVEFFTRCGYVVDPSYFGQLDQNGDGSLEFREVLTLYYIMRTRDASCDSCGVNLPQLYFTCVQCFDSVGDTYDLCATCYSARRFHHPHGSFLDSYVLLRSRRRLPPRANPNLVVDPSLATQNACQGGSWSAALEALNIMGEAINAANSCDMM